MLKELRIRNFAIIDDLEVEFFQGLNIITGETGAGKSILLGALGLLLGSRASMEDIRTGCESAEVEGVFGIHSKPELIDRLKDRDLWDAENKDFVSIRRVVSRSGRNRIYINGYSTNLTDLKELVAHLIEIHGQNEHQRLLNPDLHLEFLDSYGGLLKERNDIRCDFEKLEAVQKELQHLKDQQEQSRQKADLLKYQLQEIEKAALSCPEEETLEQERKILQNAEKLYSITWNSYETLYASDRSVLSELKLISHQIHQVEQIDPSKSEWVKRLQNIFIQLEDLALEYRDYAQKSRIDPERLNEIESRLFLIKSLKKKYGGSVSDILVYADKIRRELNGFRESQDEINQQQDTISELKKLLAKKATLLSEKRQEIAKNLTRAVEAELAELSMEGAGFSINFSFRPDEAGFIDRQGQKIALGPRGLDAVEFLFCPNPGEGYKPLVKIISGGELSRVMLAIKNILAACDDIPVLIFDEIDAGIGGKVGEMVAVKLKTIASSRQVLCVTHLPQIASRADAHFLIRKDVRDGRTHTLISRLGFEERVAEIARMASGKVATKAALEHARDLLG